MIFLTPKKVVAEDSADASIQQDTKIVPNLLLFLDQ